MDEFEKQPSSTSRRQRAHSGTFDDSLSEISSTRGERTHRKEADLLYYQKLQAEYDDLLTKYAQAENTIDQLRIGAKLNLYSDLPPPQQSVAVSVSKERQPRIFNFPKPNQAVLTQPGAAQNARGDQRNSATFWNQASGGKNVNTDLDLTPEVRADGIRTSLMFQVESLQENVEDLQEQVMVGEWGEPEMKELHEICTNLRQQHKQMKRELREAKGLEGRARSSSISGNESTSGEFLPEDSLEGQLYRLGLRLDEVNEQIEGSLRRMSPTPPGNLAQRNSDLGATGRKYSQQPDSDLQRLVERLRNVKDSSAKQEDNLSRSANSLADVEDIESNDGDTNDRHSTRNFGLDPHEFGDEEDGKKVGHGIDLQESGYFASETMSVSVGDPGSEPLSTAYLSNSAGAGQLNFPRDDTSLFDQQSVTSSPEVSRRFSNDSLGVSPEAPRSRSASHRSRTNTMDTNRTNPQDTSPPSPPSPHRTAYHEVASPESPHPQASSSMLSEQPRPRSQSNGSGRQRSRAGTTESRNSRDRVGSESQQGPASHVDILRTDHDERDPYANGLRDRTISTHSSPRSNHNAAQDSLQSSPRRDSSKPPDHQQARRQRSMSSADSRVSTPLFLPHPGARPKDANRRDKRRPATAETERGFDSGFFGSEGSRISRSVYSPDIPPTHPVDKIHRPLLREPSVTESEEERLHVPATQTPLRYVPRSREQRRRRSRLQSLSETDEDRGLETSSKTPIRSSSSSQRRGHRHTPTFPASRSDNERSRRVDDSLRRPSSSPNLYDPPSDRLHARSGLGRTSATPSRHDSSRRSMADAEVTPRTGPRSDHDGRPMDKQSLRSYPGMDRESVRSGRRSRRDGDSSSAYSDSGRKYKRDPVDKLRQELQRLGAQLQEEASARTLQAHMYDDLRRKHDDLEREIARKNAEQQMTSMYDGLRSKYDDLAKTITPPSGTARQNTDDDVKKRLEELAKEVNDLKNRGNDTPGTVRFLCPFCGGVAGHHHGDYYYPGFAGPVPSTPVHDRPATPRGLHDTSTQCPYIGSVPQHVRHPTTPTATSTPFFQGVGVSPGIHHHTNTYPGVVAGPNGILTGSPIHHIHHLPAGRSAGVHNEETDDYSSDEDDRYRSKRRSTSSRAPRTSRRTRDTFYDDEQLDGRRLHMSLDEANKAARHMQRISKRMLGSIASDLIRSGHR